MFNPESYLNKRVSLTYKDGDIYTGIITGFDSPDDDLPEYSITIQSDQMGEIAIDQHEIKDLKILD